MTPKALGGGTYLDQGKLSRPQRIGNNNGRLPLIIQNASVSARSKTEVNLESLPEISKSTRIGSCINKPGKFIGIGLNYSDHAVETGAKPPSEPIVFMKATSCIIGPYDDVVIPKN